MRRLASPRTSGSIAIAFAAAALVALVAIALTGCACTPIDQPIVEQGGVAATGTVQADLPLNTSATVDATDPASVTTSTAEPTPTVWPTKVGTFAKNFKKAAWYPTYVPKGYKIDSLDIVEMGVKTGLVCDIVYLNGDKVLQFTQGSPTDRQQPVVSAGKVPWGTDKADVVYQDPTDTTSPPMIVYAKGGTYIELQGDPALDELKKVAASMVPVK